MKPRQVGAARRLLGWTKTELAGRARVNLRTVSNIEAGKHAPSAHTLEALQGAFESAGVDFINGNDLRLKERCELA